MANLPAGDLARVTNHESNSAWPFTLEVVAYWGEGRKGKRRSITITEDMYFGRGQFNAPLTGDAIIGMIEKLRKAG